MTLILNDQSLCWASGVEWELNQKPLGLRHPKGVLFRSSARSYGKKQFTFSIIAKLNFVIYCIEIANYLSPEKGNITETTSKMQPPKIFNEHRENEKYEHPVEVWKQLIPLQGQYVTFHIERMAFPGIILYKCTQVLRVWRTAMITFLYPLMDIAVSPPFD